LSFFIGDCSLSALIKTCNKVSDAHQERLTALTGRIKKLYLQGLVLSHNVVLVHIRFSGASHSVGGGRRRLRSSDQIDQGAFTSSCFSKNDNIACFRAM
jgi:hypothetical protein